MRVWLHRFVLRVRDLPNLVGWLLKHVNSAGILARDLEAFAKHAKRSIVSIDDVKLAVRRNVALVRAFQFRVLPARPFGRRATCVTEPDTRS